MTVTIKGWQSLSKYGIKFLTGEADPYGMRILFDLNEKGIQIISDFLGIPTISNLPSNWNSGSIASILLSVDFYIPLSKFILFHIDKVPMVVIDKWNFLYGGYYLENQIEELEKLGSKVYKNPNSNPGINRNMHQFSGRTY